MTVTKKRKLFWMLGKGMFKQVTRSEQLRWRHRYLLIGWCRTLTVGMSPLQRSRSLPSVKVGLWQLNPQPKEAMRPNLLDKTKNSWLVKTLWWKALTGKVPMGHPLNQSQSKNLNSSWMTFKMNWKTRLCKSIYRFSTNSNKPNKTLWYPKETRIR